MKLYIQLKYGEYQKRFIEEWKNGWLRVGEVSINESKVLIPFRKDVDLSNPEDWIAIDTNENNITAVSSNPHIMRIETKMRDIRYTYFLKKRKIQKLKKFRPKTSKRLMKKYSGRERRRIYNLCHKIAKRVVHFAKENNLGIIMEDLKNIRKHIKYSRKINRRLHSWNFTSILHRV